MSVASRELAPSGTRETTTRRQSRLNPSADSGDLSLALDSSRRQLEAAVQRKSELLQRCSSLAEKVSSLEFALAKAHQYAYHDELTGLPNRRLLLDRFGQASALANRRHQESVLPDRHHVELALLFFDINDFKSVNDELGHEAGDKLLQQVATRLSSSIRQSDTACRYGGDEFVVLLTEISNYEHAVMALQKIRDRLAAPYVIDRHSIRMTVSNGMATYPGEAQSFIELLRLSDRSMFRDKSGFRSRAGGGHESNVRLHDALKTPCFGR